MAQLIAREAEIKELQSLYHSGQAEFVVIYGRRRVGKTFLVRNVFDGQFTFEHTAMSPIEFDGINLLERQLQSFYIALKNCGSDIEQCPTNWVEAFQALREFLQSRSDTSRQVVFLDELPWMDVPGSGFLTAFEHFWNSWASGQDRIMLVVCGSATSWISDHLINSYGGLYGRTTREIKLSPFTLSECEQYYESRGIVMNRYDQLQCYMIMGGMPYYLSYLERGKSLAQNIDQLFFSTSGKLHQEFDRLFRSLFVRHEQYAQVVHFLSTRNEGFTRKEISQATGVPYGGALTTILRSLEASDFIKHYVHYNGSKREVYYRLTDFFVLFYLHFIDKHPVRPNFWQASHLLPELNAWRGFAFENVCFTHISMLKRALGIPAVDIEYSPWHSRISSPGAQIDLVIDRSDRVINLCEMKFSLDLFEVKRDYDMNLRHKVATFIEETHCRKSVHPVLVTTFGIKKNAYSDFFQNVITMDDLFGSDR